MRNPRRVAVIGLGSMGKRRTGILRQNHPTSPVAAYDPSAERRADAEQRFGIETFDSPEKLYDWKPEAAIISTPPLLHTSYAHALAQRDIPFMVEASVVDDGLADLITELEERGVVGVPSCTMRFHPGIRMLRKLLLDQCVIGDLSSRCAFHYHMGQFLPDWHPHEHVGSFYVGARETSGTREMVCFENVWLSWLFGMPVDVAAQVGKLTEIDADIEDIFQLLINYDSGTLGTMQIDVISRVPYRSLRIVTEDGVLEWSARENLLRHYDGASGDWTVHSEVADEDYRGGNFSGEEMYAHEIDAFFAEADGERGAFPFDFRSDRVILSLLRGALSSADSGQRVTLSDC